MAERKRRKVEAAKAAQAEALAAQEADDEEAHGPIIEVEVEEVHVAQEFVVEVTADSVEDADIAVTVEERRERHAAVRERIEARRRCSNLLVDHLAEMVSAQDAPGQRFAAV